MKFKLCHLRDEASNIWILESDELALGVSSDSGWTLRLRGENFPLRQAKDMVFLLPVLEMKRQLLHAHLRRVVEHSPDMASCLRDFPEALLLSCAFEMSVSDYWPLRAVEWLESAPHLVASLEGPLSALHSQLWATQMLKQKIRSILKKHRLGQ